jgi:hypothetical protein
MRLTKKCSDYSTVLAIFYFSGRGAPKHLPGDEPILMCLSPIWMAVIKSLEKQINETAADGAPLSARKEC